MLSIIGALFPVFLLICVGWALRRAAFAARWELNEAFWAGAERLTYFILFPALLVRSLSNADLAGFSVAPMAAAVILGVLAVTVALRLLRKNLGVDGPGYSSVLQGAVRFNTYVGFAAALALYGPAGQTLAAVCVAILVPTVNVLSVATIARGNGAAGVRGLVRPLARNPLILACLAGIALNFTGLGLPFGLDATLEILGKAALPLGLLAVGAALDLGAIGRARAAVFAACGLKLVLLPVAFWAACTLFGVQGLTATVAVLWASLPTASSAYILARQLGGDAELMAGIISASTLGAFVTVPLMLTLLG